MIEIFEKGDLIWVLVFDSASIYRGLPQVGCNGWC